MVTTEEVRVVITVEVAPGRAPGLGAGTAKAGGDRDVLEGDLGRGVRQEGEAEGTGDQHRPHRCGRDRTGARRAGLRWHSSCSSFFLPRELTPRSRNWL